MRAGESARGRTEMSYATAAMIRGRITTPTVVKAAQRSHTCDHCQKSIEIGESYVRYGICKHPSVVSESIKLHNSCAKEIGV